MSLPSSREQFKDYCLRQLGAPVLDINIADEQIEDNIDYALSYFAEYHFDGTEKIYYKYQITGNVYSDAVHHVTLDAPGTLYSNTDTITFTGGSGEPATANLVTHANGSIASVNLLTNGDGYANPPTITINTSTGSGGAISAHLGGYIDIPENIIGVGKVFPFSYFTSSQDMFSVDYQLALNNIYTIINSQLAPWYMALQHLQLFHEVLVGRTPFRYNKIGNKLYIDKLKARIKLGEYIVFEAYNVLDPETYSDVWKDRFLLKYATALIKRQWGTNLKKFSGVMLPGGVQFNGQVIFDEAVEEIKALEEEMLNSWSIPVLDIVA